MAGRTPTLHMLCGYICAGKSTLAAQLGRLPETIVISEDPWIAALYGPEPKAVSDFDRFALRLRRLLQQHVVEVLAAGASVVLDMPANSPRVRRWMRLMAEKAGAEHLLHFIDLPGDLCLSRLHERNASGTYQFVLNGYEPVFDREIAPQPEEDLNVLHYKLDPARPSGALKVVAGYGVRSA